LIGRHAPSTRRCEAPAQADETGIGKVFSLPIKGKKKEWVLSKKANLIWEALPKDLWIDN
jgi:hypothetical protein